MISLHILQIVIKLFSKPLFIAVPSNFQHVWVKMTIITIEMREDVGLEISSIKLLIETLEMDGNT